MGGGAWKSTDWAAYTASTIKGKTTASAIYTTSSLKPQFNPATIKIRESCDSTEHPNSTPIIIGLDVTGSMDKILMAVAKKLNVLVEEIYKRNTISDPQIMFQAIGDSTCDSAPLQVTQFESDIKIAQQLTELWFEKGGGGNGFESYPLVWYFAANHTSIDSFTKRNKKGFIFTMGDDCYPSVLRKTEIKDIFNDTIEKDIPVEELLAQVNRKYEVFHFMLGQGGSSYSINEKAWKDLLGERAIYINDYDKIPEIIVSILETMAGKTKEEVLLSWDGTTAAIVSTAISGLTEKVSDKKVIVF